MVKSLTILPLAKKISQAADYRRILTSMGATTTTPNTAPPRPVGTPTACDAAADDQIPLVAMLGKAHDAFAAEFDELIAHSDVPGVSLAHYRTVLRHLDDEPLRASQIVGRCGVSKQAVSQQLTQLDAGGYIVLRPDPSDGRARLVELTDSGRRAREVVRECCVQIEQRWAAMLGADDEALRRALTTILENRRSPGC